MVAIWGPGFVVFFVVVVSCDSVTESDVTLAYDVTPAYDDDLTLSEDETTLYLWNGDDRGAYDVTIVTDREDVVTVGTPSFTVGNDSSTVRVNISAVFIGYANVTISITDHNNEVVNRRSLRVGVVLSYQLVNQIYMGVLGALLFVVFVNMGAVFDVSVFRTVAKNPVAPLVGLFSQFVAMPLMAFGLSKAFFPNEPLWQLGMFLSGTVPGGGTSNMWTYLIGGNFDLSLVMTTVSSLVAFAAIPLWTAALGPFIADGTDIVVPVSEIVLLVLGLVIPCVIGFLVQKWLPRLAKVFERMLTPFILFIFVFTLTYGAYANRYIFYLLTWKIAVAALTLPTVGYFFGSMMAYLLKCPTKDVIAVSIETGIQNVTLAVFMLNYSLPQPASTIAIAMPGCTAIMTPIPIVIIGLALHTHWGNINRRNLGILSDNILKCRWNLTAETFKEDVETKPREDHEITSNSFEMNDACYTNVNCDAKTVI